MITDKELHDINLEIMGVIKKENGEYYYQYLTWVRDETTDDDLWETMCIDMDIIREVYPDLEYCDSGADNDTTWCTITRFR